jgi:hypothetical protein
MIEELEIDLFFQRVKDGTLSLCSSELAEYSCGERYAHRTVGIGEDYD